MLAQINLRLAHLRQKIALDPLDNAPLTIQLMAALKKPKLLLLDEHTAALDPKTAAKVLEITDKLVTENKLTTLMVTHNMHDAIAYGNRLIMMHEGRVIVDVSGEEKKNLTIEQLLGLFETASGSKFASDRDILSKATK